MTSGPGRGPYTYVAFTREEAARLAAELRAAAWLHQAPPSNPHEALRAQGEGAEFVLWHSGKLAWRGPRARAVLEELARLAGVAGEGGPLEVGSDEAGKGEWLGPMVVAAVAVAPERRLALRLDGVRDSKDLAGPVREALAGRIREQAWAHNLVVIGPRRFNELWAEMHARGETLNDLLWWAHRKALEPVLSRIGAAAPGGVRVVLDEFDRTRRAAEQFRGLVPAGAEVQQRPRAEEALAVAAASVLARAERDRQVALLQRQLGLAADLAPEAARRHARVAEFAKVAYLR